MPKMPILTEAQIRDFVEREFIDEHGVSTLTEVCEQYDTEFEFCRVIALLGAKVLAEFLREKLGRTDLTLDHILLKISDELGEAYQEHEEDLA